MKPGPCSGKHRTVIDKMKTGRSVISAQMSTVGCSLAGLLQRRGLSPPCKGGVRGGGQGSANHLVRDRREPKVRRAELRGGYRIRSQPASSEKPAIGYPVPTPPSPFADRVAGSAGPAPPSPFAVRATGSAGPTPPNPPFERGGKRVGQGGNSIGRKYVCRSFQPFTTSGQA
jgi:hypothetical protein